MKGATMLQRTIALAVALGMLCVAPGLRSQEKEKGTKSDKAKLVPDKMGPLEKGTWRYEVESVIDPDDRPGENLAVFRIRARVPMNDELHVNCGTNFTRVTEAEADGKTELAEFLLIFELYRGLGEGGKEGLILQRRVVFIPQKKGKKGMSARERNSVPEGTELKNIMKIKEGSGALKIGEHFVFSNIGGREVSIRTYKKEKK
jgi:hypothetical protein